MTRHLLDTNHLADAIRRVSIVRDRVQHACQRGDVFGTTGGVLCELMVGVANRKDADQCRLRLDRFLKHVRLWPIDLTIASRYPFVYRQLQAAGRVLSQVDLMLAATALELNAVLLTTDNDIDAITGLPRANWLAAKTHLTDNA